MEASGMTRQLVIACVLLVGIGGLPPTRAQRRESERPGSSAQKKPALSLVQIEQLIKIGTPDQVIAQEIRERALNFSPTPQDLESLRRRGAGSKTIDALSMAKLLISSTPPDCEVFVDGTPRGRTDAEGKLALPDLSPGQHHVILKKPSYRDAEQTVVLAAAQETSFTMKLELSAGFLTVQPNISGATIEVERLGKFTNSTSDLQCPPGKYTVTVSVPRYKTITTTVDISPGVKTNLPVSLEPDPAAVGQLLKEGRELYLQGDFRRVISITKEVLSLQPNNRAAMSNLALAYFMADDFDQFEERAAEALRAGVPLTLPVQHHHTLAPIHPVKLVISSTTISFDPVPGSGSCTQRAFTASLRDIVANKVTRNQSDEVFLNVKLQDPQNPKKSTNFNFADRLSQSQKGSKGLVVVSRPAAIRALTAIQRVLERAGQ
jgi:hypothetical protein